MQSERVLRGIYVLKYPVLAAKDPPFRKGKKAM